MYRLEWTQHWPLSSRFPDLFYRLRNAVNLPANKAIVCQPKLWALVHTTPVAADTFRPGLVLWEGAVPPITDILFGVEAPSWKFLNRLY